MLDQLFIQILNMSFNASIVIIIVLAIRLLLKKAPKMFSYVLWSVVLIRLILPISFESPFSLMPTQANPISTEILYATVPVVDTGITSINNVVNVALPAATPIASVNPLQIWVVFGSLIWVIGIFIMLLYSFITYLKLKKRLVNARHYRDNIYLVEALSTPFVMGVFHPQIYLPSTLSDQERTLILHHEQTHIRRLDPLFKIIAFFTLCLHWFNPLVWVAFFSCSSDMEMACDEAVIKQMGHDVKKEYSSSLLSLTTGRRILGATPLAFGEGDTKKRVKNVLQYKSPKFWVLALATVAIVLIGIGLISNPINASGSIEKNDAQALWNAHTPYVGDNSAVSKLLNLMPLPEGLTHDGIKLHTEGTERGLEWILTDVEDTGYDETNLQRDALLLFASIDNLEDFYVTISSSFGEDVTLHYDLKWAEQQLGSDVKSYGVSKEKLQELMALTVSRLPLVEYGIAKMDYSNGETVTEVFLKDPGLAKAIWMDSVIKSARFEGMSLSELEIYYRIRITYPEVDETHDYYAYLLDDGTPVLQSDSDGTYSIMSSELFPELVAFFQ